MTLKRFPYPTRCVQVARALFPSSLSIMLALIVSCGDSTGTPSEPEDEVPIGEGIIYYVSPEGDDSDAGTLQSPWRTIHKAAETVAAGDTVYIREGTYAERLIPRNPGIDGDYVMFSAFPGEVVTLDGAAISLPSDWGGLVEVVETSYIKISGLRVINARGGDNSVGILVELSDHVIISDNYTYNTESSGIGLWNSTNCIIDNNEVELACNDGEQECISVGESRTFELSNNYVHNGGPGTIGGEGICLKEGSSNGRVYGNIVVSMSSDRTGIYLDAWDKHTYDMEVYRNTVHDCGAGISLASEFGGLLEDIRVFNNIAYHNRTNGLEIGDWGESGVSSRPIKDVIFVNNTLHDNGSGEWGGGIMIENEGLLHIEGIIVRNNIFSQNLLYQIFSDFAPSEGRLAVDHNLVDGFRDEIDGELYGDDYVEGDPMFRDPASADFHLGAGSPAIDAGSSVDAPDIDFDGVARPMGAGVDIGAYEFSE